MPLYEVHSISVSIDHDWREAYDFACVPENFPRWASGLASGIEKSGDEWIAHALEGTVRVRFSPRNEFGVLDHIVTTGEGAKIHCPLRIVANGTGSEVIFTLFRSPGMSDEKFDTDANWVQRDLTTLRGLLEGTVPSGQD